MFYYNHITLISENVAIISTKTTAVSNQYFWQRLCRTGITDNAMAHI